jgi:hypothetical protein
MRVWTMATIVAFAFCAATVSAQAASIGSAVSAPRASTVESVAEKIAYRRCWWRNGVRHCRWYRSGYSPYYGVPSNQLYSSGSSIGIILGIR